MFEGLGVGGFFTGLGTVMNNLFRSNCIVDSYYCNTGTNGCKNYDSSILQINTISFSLQHVQSSNANVCYFASKKLEISALQINPSFELQILMSKKLVFRNYV